MNFLLEDLIDLPQVSLRNAFREGQTIFLILECKEERVPCPHCKNKTDELNQVRNLRVRDLPISGHITYLEVPRRQFYCKHCRKYFTEELDFVESGRRFTNRYERNIFERLKASSIEQVRKEEDLSWDQVHGIHQHQYEAQKKTSWGKVKRLGLDEIAKRKGHKDFVTVVSDLEQGELIEVVNSHAQEEIIETLMEQPLEVREMVEEVSVDMWGGFPKVIEKVFPNAKIVVDRFHVMKAVNENLNKVRKQVNFKVKVRGAKWLLLKNKEDLNTDELAKLELVLKQSERLREAYELKEKFREIYEETQECEEGKRKIEKWLCEAQRIYSDAVKTIRNHLETICNYFLNRTTNGVMEGINNRLKLIKRQAYGFINFENMRRRCLACFIS